jgi:hypothetical protein
LHTIDDLLSIYLKFGRVLKGRDTFSVYSNVRRLLLNSFDLELILGFTAAIKVHIRMWVFIFRVLNAF